MARPRIDDRDAAKRRFVQLRLYGEIALLLDERCMREGKARATLVEELMRAAWHVDLTPQPIEPEHRFERAGLPGNVFTAPARPEPDPAPPVHRARVFSPPRARPGFR